MLPDYAELHCLSNFSFLRGASHPEELVTRAKAAGYAALAITDEASMAGVVRAHLAAKAAGLPLIVGAGFTLVDGLRLVLLARNREGYGNLSALIAAARRRAEKGSYRLSRGDLAGIGGAGAVPDCLALWLPGADASAEDARFVAERFPERAWIAVELHCGPDDAARLAALRAVSAAAGLPLVAAGDVHMHVRGRRPLQDVLTALRLKTTVSAAGHALFPNGERHLRSRLRLARLYPPELLAETLAVAARCRFSLDELRYEYPDEIVPPGETPASYLRREVEAGLARRYGGEITPDEEAQPVAVRGGGAAPTVGRPMVFRRRPAPGPKSAAVPPGAAVCGGGAAPTDGGVGPSASGRVPAEVRAQVEHELALIAELAYEPYFLTVHEIVRFARSVGILCQGRGSAANSAVCYALGITEVDPARSSLLFERFVSKERNEPPDIDVDFEHERREEVIQHIYEKYGRDRAALAAAVITYRTKGALRDVGRALGFGRAEIDALTGSLAWWDRREELPDRCRAVGLDPGSPKVVRWLALAAELRGFPRHLSQHVGGFVISRGPLSRLVPVENAAMADRTVIQWDKDDIDALGLMKVDVLALGMLSAVRRALELVSARRRRSFGLADVPAEDPVVYDMICRADTMGVFQIESRAQMAMLPRLRPRRFYDLVVEVAIVRPGPIQGDMVHPYLRRRQGIEPVDYPSEAVKGVLGRTLGVPIFQEQVMQLAVVAAGFTPGEADSLRRSMAAWKRKGGLGPFEQKLIEGMAERGYAEEFARRIFRQIEGFGEYGFPESHAASFALLVYVSAWLKCREPAAFLCALLNSQPMGFYAPSQLIQDARRHRTEVRPVDVTASEWDSTLEEIHRPGQPAVRLGLREVVGLSRQAGERIAAARAAAPFTGIADLVARTGIARRDLDLLAAADALHPLAGHRRQAAWEAAGLDWTRQTPPDAPVGGPPRGRTQRWESPTEAVWGEGAPPTRDRPDGRRFAAEAVGSPPPGRTQRWGQPMCDVRGDGAPPTTGGRAEASAVAPPFQLDLFAVASPGEDGVRLAAPLEGESLVADYAALGFSLRRHPLALLRSRLAALRYVTAAEVAAGGNRRLVRAAGLVTCRQRPGTASGVVFVTLEDETGLVNVVVHPRLVERQRREVLGAGLLGVWGQIQREGEVVHLVAQRLVDCSPLLGRLRAESRDFC